MNPGDTGTRRPLGTDPRKVPLSVRVERRREARRRASEQRRAETAQRGDAGRDEASPRVVPTPSATDASSAPAADPVPDSQSRRLSDRFRAIQWPRLRLPAAPDEAADPDEIDLREPKVHPRIAGRRDEVRSAERAKRSRVRLVAIAFAVALTVCVAVLFSPLFDVDHLLVQGVEGAPASEVQQASGIGDGTALFAIDPSEVRSRVEDLGWVAHASVGVHWPDRVEMLVTPHRPLANVAVGDGAPDALATTSGAVFDYSEVEPLLPFSGGLPVVRLDDTGRLPDALVALRGLGTATTAATAELRTNDSGLRLLLGSGEAEGAEVVMGSPEGLPEKAQAIEAVLAGTVEVRCLERLDVSVPSRITIERTPGCDLPPPEGTEDR